MLTVGIIGLGVGKKHIEAYDGHEKSFVKTLCDFDETKHAEISKKYPDKIFSSSASTILTDDDIKLVSLASYDNFHAEQIITAFDNQKHVFTEKPLCLYREELDLIKQKTECNPDLKISSNLVLRSNPRFKRIRNDIQKGVYGELFYIEADYLWGRVNKFNGWRSQMDFYSIICGAAIHMIDLVMWLVDKKPVDVYAMGNDLATRNMPLKYNSFVVLLLEFNNGLIAKITANGGCVHPHFHGLNVFGSKKTVIHDLSDSIWVETSDPESVPRSIKEPYPAKEFRKEVITSFVDHILDKTKKPLVSQQEVFDVMSVCFSAEEAMQCGRTLEIKYT